MRHRLAPEADYYRLPEPPRPALPTAGFVICTVAVIPGCTEEHWANVQQVYEQALSMLDEVPPPCPADDDTFFWN